MTCTFTPDRGGPIGEYLGSIDEYGVALGAVEKGHLIWGVIAETEGVAEATAGVGLGANVLVGGTGRAFSV